MLTRSPETDCVRLVLDLVAGAEPMRQFSELLDRAFEVPPERRFLDDFPVWDAALVPGGPEMLRLGAFAHELADVAGSTEPGRLVASVGLRLASLSTVPGRLPVKVGLLGAVATDRAFRGQGLASELVRQAVRWAGEQGAKAVFLWGSEHSLYGRLGFELCGRQAVVPVAGLGLSPSAAEVGQGWNPAIFELMKGRRGGLEHAQADRGWLEAHQGAQWYWLGSAARPKAWLAIDRGIDLKGMVHEWGGEPESLRALLGWLAVRRPEAVLLGPPGLLEDLGLAGNGPAGEFLCLARVLDPAGLLAAFAPEARLSIQPVPGSDRTWYRVSLDDGAGLELTEGELCRLLFGPVAPGSDEKANALPLPLWFWGLDAV